MTRHFYRQFRLFTGNFIKVALSGLLMSVVFSVVAPEPAEAQRARICGPGLESNFDGTGCIPCPSSTWDYEYSDDNGQCKDCPDGFWPTANLQGCRRCPDYQVSESGSRCFSCRDHGHGPNAERSRCIPCFIPDEITPNGCRRNCDPGEHHAGHRTCNRCPSGSIPDWQTEHRSCTECPQGDSARPSDGSACCDRGLRSHWGIDGRCTNCDIRGPNSARCAERIADSTIHFCDPGMAPGQLGGLCMPCAGEGDRIIDGLCNKACTGNQTWSTITGRCETCPDGEFALDSECIPCPANTFLSVEHGECIPCPAGETSVSGGECESCPAGHVSDGNGGACRACPLGQQVRPTAPVQVNTVCELCHKGFYSNEPGSADGCIECPSNSFTRSVHGAHLEIGSTECNECPAGMVRDDNNARECVACPAGDYRAAGEARCTQCPEGHYSADGAAECTACPAGQESGVDRISCVPCQDREFSPGGTQCKACAPSQTVSDDKSACVFCEEGQIIRDGECHSCDPGHRFADGACVRCPYNTINDGVNSHCETCTDGEFANAEQSECITCGDNERYSHSTGACVACPEGTFAHASQYWCVIQCPNGDIADPYGVAPQQLRLRQSCYSACEEDAYPSFYTYFTNKHDANDNQIYDTTVLQIRPPNGERETVNTYATFNQANKLCIHCPTTHYYDPGQWRDGNWIFLNHLEPDHDALGANGGDGNNEPAYEFLNCSPCPAGAYVNPESGSRECQCAEGREIMLNDAGEHVCAEPLPEYPEETADVYTESECLSQGWDVTLDSEHDQLAELCEIPVEIVEVVVDKTTPAVTVSTQDGMVTIVINADSNTEENTPPASTVASTTAGALGVPSVRNDDPPPPTPRVDPSVQSDACLMRRHRNYPETNYRTCAELFGSTSQVGASFPERRSSNRLYVFQIVNTAGGVQIQPSFVMTRESVRTTNGNNTNTASNTSSGSAPAASSSSQGAKVAFVGAAAGLAVMAYALADGDISAFAWSPHAQMRYDDGNSFYAYGSRVDFAKDEWTMYWTAAQTRHNGTARDWRYGTGVNWTGEVFSAGFTNHVQGLDSDASVSFAASQEFGIWTLESSYMAEWAFTELNSTWSNRLALGGRIEYNQWFITPRAVLAWQPDVPDSKDIRFQVDVLRDL